MAAPGLSGDHDDPLFSIQDIEAVSNILFSDVVFEWVNGFLPRPFGRADFDVEERQLRNGITCGSLYQPGVEYLRKKAEGKLKDYVDDISWSDAYGRLEQLLQNADTEAKCISEVFERDNVTETEITLVFAVHLFGILVPESSLTIDKNMQNLEKWKQKCPCGCGRHFQGRNTGIGAALGWHGFPAMIAHPVTVTVRPNPANEDESDQPPSKVAALDENYEGRDAVEKKQENICDDVGVVASQVTATAVASSFAQAVKDPSLSKKFLPSVCCSTTGLMIYAYSVDEDYLISNVQENYILDPVGKFVIPTVLAVWLAINVRLTGSSSDSPIMAALAKSRFQELNRGIARSIYGEAVVGVKCFDNAKANQLGTRFFHHAILKMVESQPSV